jgi:2-hydroxychromene-2-carboxylate isomerase
MGLDGHALAAAGSGPAVLSAWQSNVETARDLGVFGASIHAYDGQLYWGQDSLGFFEAHMEGKLFA